MYYSSIKVDKKYTQRIKNFLVEYGLMPIKENNLSIFTNRGTLEGIIYQDNEGMSSKATVTIQSNSDVGVYLVMERLMKRVPKIRQTYRVFEQEVGRHKQKGSSNKRVHPADLVPTIPAGTCPTMLLSSRYDSLEDLKMSIGGPKKERKRA